MGSADFSLVEHLRPASQPRRRIELAQAMHAAPQRP
jgi:hypothetical protein